MVCWLERSALEHDHFLEHGNDQRLALEPLLGAGAVDELIDGDSLDHQFFLNEWLVDHLFVFGHVFVHAHATAGVDRPAAHLR